MAMVEFLAPPQLPKTTGVEALQHIYHTDIPGGPAEFDIEIQDEALPPRRGCVRFPVRRPDLDREADPSGPRRTGDLPWPGCSRHFGRKYAARSSGASRGRTRCSHWQPPCRTSCLPYSNRRGGWRIRLGHSDPDSQPDRMAFLLAAASDREVGYAAQKAEMGSTIAGALGWRALARELAEDPLGAVYSQSRRGLRRDLCGREVHCPAPSLRAWPVAKRAQIRETRAPMPVEGAEPQRYSRGLREATEGLTNVGS